MLLKVKICRNKKRVYFFICFTLALIKRYFLISLTLLIFPSSTEVKVWVECPFCVKMRLRRVRKYSEEERKGER